MCIGRSSNNLLMCLRDGGGRAGNRGGYPRLLGHLSVEVATFN